jgi:hypothetical protein
MAKNDERILEVDLLAASVPTVTSEAAEAARLGVSARTDAIWIEWQAPTRVNTRRRSYRQVTSGMLRLSADDAQALADRLYAATR